MGPLDQPGPGATCTLASATSRAATVQRCKWEVAARLVASAATVRGPLAVPVAASGSTRSQCHVSVWGHQSRPTGRTSVHRLAQVSSESLCCLVEDPARRTRTRPSRHVQAERCSVHELRGPNHGRRRRFDALLHVVSQRSRWSRQPSRSTTSISQRSLWRWHCQWESRAPSQLLVLCCLWLRGGAHRLRCRALPLAS